MAPNITSQSLCLAAETVKTEQNDKLSNHDDFDENDPYKWRISWRNVLAFIYLHAASFYGLGLILTGYVQLYTFLFAVGFAIISGLGVTGGAHRLWAHRAYKATWQLRLILAFLQTAAFQNHIYEWVRDHRVHHKFTDTDADPHNVNRGFFFSHMGWLLVKKHRDVRVKGKTVDMSDLESDPIVVWQRRTYYVTVPLLAFIFPTWAPVYFWNEDPWIAWYCTMFRYVLILHGTWCVNSVAHIWGSKPFDKNISPVESSAVGIFAFGEGWHNYHHVFPWDYKAAELGNYSVNLTTGFIDLFAKIGWAYDMKVVSPDVIRKRAERTGDGSLKDADDPEHHMNVWGWGDKDMTQSDKECVKLLHSVDAKLS